MIYTVTFNPSLDYILEGPAVRLGQVNRISGAEMVFGGKGISQSVILTGLGVPNLALGLAGGYTGSRLRALLKERGVQEELTEIAGETRINVKLRADRETEINAPGPAKTLWNGCTTAGRSWNSRWITVWTRLPRARKSSSKNSKRHRKNSLPLWMTTLIPLTA